MYTPFVGYQVDKYTQYIYANTQINFKSAYISVNAYGGFAYWPTQSIIICCLSPGLSPVYLASQDNARSPAAVCLGISPRSDVKIVKSSQVVVLRTHVASIRTLIFSSSYHYSGSGKVWVRLAVGGGGLLPFTVYWPRRS